MEWEGESDAEAARDAVQREIERRRVRGETFTAVEVPRGTKLARQFWGQAWQRHLESFEHFSGRLAGGRSYLRRGQLYNLETEPGVIRAEVAGGALYEVAIRVRPMAAEDWAMLVETCMGKVSSTLDLLAGRLSEEVMAVLTAADGGLFPAAGEVKVVCSCPDHADVCKHGAAVLYAVGLEFDKDPASFFRLRGVAVEDLCRQASASLHGCADGDEALAMTTADLELLFGIDLGEGEAGAQKKGGDEPAL